MPPAPIWVNVTSSAILRAKQDRPEAADADDNGQPSNITGVRHLINIITIETTRVSMHVSHQWRKYETNIHAISKEEETYPNKKKQKTKTIIDSIYKL